MEGKEVRLLKRWIVAPLLFLFALAFAGAKITPQGIVVNPVPGALKVKVWVDKDPGKTGNATYRIGDPIYVYVSVTQEAYVYLFDVKPDGSIDLFLPNPYDRRNRLKAGETRRYPPPGARYRFTIDGPPGEELVLAVATRRPLSSREIGDLERGEVRIRGLRALSKALSIVGEPLPGDAWASDWARFRVIGQGPPPPPPSPGTGTLDVRSDPTGAQVYLDGDYLGRTPLVASVRAGRHRVEVRKAGYAPYRANVRVAPGERVQIYARLVPEVRTGRLEVRSQPEGARVYLDGGYRGRTPLELELDPGVYDLRLALPGYGEYREQVRIRAGETTRVYARLAPEKARLVVRTNVRARVFLDGYELGWTKNGRFSTSVRGGRRWLVILAPGYVPYVEEVVLEPGETLVVQADLRRVRY